MSPIEIESDQVLLYTKADVNSSVANSIKKGSILFYRSSKNGFLEVYTKNPRVVHKTNRWKYRFYIHNVKYKTYASKYKHFSARIYELPFDPNKDYIKGPRGGCYYYNSNGNKQYVNRSYCARSFPEIKYKPTNPKKYRKPSSYSTSCGARTQAGGYCKRKVRGGGRCWQH